MRTESRSHQHKMPFSDQSCHIDITSPMILLFFRVHDCSYNEMRRRVIQQKPVCCEANPRLKGSPCSFYVRLDSLCLSACDLLSAVYVSLALHGIRCIAASGLLCHSLSLA